MVQTARGQLMSVNEKGKGRTNQDDGDEEMRDVSDLNCLANVAECEHVQTRKSLIGLGCAANRLARVLLLAVIRLTRPA
jgi:hypothetical protein